MNQYLPQLQDCLQQLAIAECAAHATKLLGYLELLQRWNRVYNLTAIRDPHEMLVQHLFDSLAVLPLIDKQQEKLSLADIGSGAGLPGLVLAICKPQWQVYCVDTVGKKAAFMRQAAGSLGVQNAQIINSRCEQMPSLQVDVLISRAFASMADFVLLAGHHLTNNGTMYAMKAKEFEAEAAELAERTAWRIEHTHRYTVPQMQAERCLIEINPPKEND